MLTSAQLRHKKMRSIRMFSSERYFREVVYREIEPSEEQIKQLEPIIKNFGKDGNQIQKEFREKFDEHNSTYWDEIKSLLTEEQLELLEESFKKRRDEFRKSRPDSTRRGRGKGRRGPPSEHRRERDSVRIDSVPFNQE